MGAKSIAHRESSYKKDRRPTASTRKSADSDIDAGATLSQLTRQREKMLGFKREYILVI
jgi:hypothetical protein